MKQELYVVPAAWRTAVLILVLGGLSPLVLGSTNCAPPILAGRWNLKSMAVTNRITGSGSVGGVAMSIDGEVGSTAMGGPGFFFDVACDGSITNGRGQDTISGHLIQVAEAPEARSTTTTRYSGNETYTFTGSVRPGAAGMPELLLNVRVVSGSTTAQGETVVVSAFGTFSQPFGGTEDLSGQTMSMRLPVLNYDPDQGTLEVDMKQSPLFQALQAQVDAITSQMPIPTRIEYSGSASFESAAVEIKSVEPTYKKYYLKGVPALNPITVEVNWRQSGGTRRVTFLYGDQTETDESGNTTITQDFDMGKAADRLSVTADAGGSSDGPQTIELKKVVVSPWAKPILTSGGAGIVYEGDAHWPPLPSIHEAGGNAPIVGGLWTLLFSGGRNKCEIKAYSQGPPASQGALEWDYQIGVPFTSYQLRIQLNGHTSTTINDNGLKLTGDAALKPYVWTGSKTYGLGELAPGATAAACALSSRLCSFIGGMGIEASLTFTAGGSGTFSADENEDKIEWDTGTAKLKLRGQLALSVAPPPLDDVISARIWGAATACLDLMLMPEIRVDHFGADLEVGYSVSIIGIQAFSDTYHWPLVGGGCGGSPAPLPNPSLFANSDAAGGLPTDGQARIALGPDGQTVTVWSGLTGGNTRPSGDIFLQLTDASGRHPPLLLTQDAAADQSPRAAFDRHGRVVVVWQRNPSTLTAPGTNQIAEFASGFEIAYALVDPAASSQIAGGLLTTNTSFDFGPGLEVNSAGDLLLTWGQSRSLFMGGDDEDPVSICARVWDGTAWSAPEIVVDSLRGVYGWRGALAANGDATVAFTLDQDLLFDTAADRELVVVQRTKGTWGQPRQLTANTLADSCPALTYLPDGKLALGWLSGGQVVGTIGDLSRAPQVWINTNDFLGLSFSRATLLARGTRLFALWPAASDLYTVEIPTSSPLDFSYPSEPQVLRPDTTDVETAFAARLDETGALYYAAIAAAVETRPDGLPTMGATSNFRAETIRFDAPTVVRPRIRVAGPLVAGRARVAWESVVGATYVLERSQNLRDWTSVQELMATTTDSGLDVDVPSAPNAHFFRLRVR
jgi:hypothetical protein